MPETAKISQRCTDQNIYISVHTSGMALSHMMGVMSATSVISDNSHSTWSSIYVSKCITLDVLSGESEILSAHSVCWAYVLVLPALYQW